MFCILASITAYTLALPHYLNHNNPQILRTELQKLLKIIPITNLSETAFLKRPFSQKRSYFRLPNQLIYHDFVTDIQALFFAGEIYPQFLYPSVRMKIGDLFFSQKFRWLNTKWLSFSHLYTKAPHTYCHLQAITRQAYQFNHFINLSIFRSAP